VKIFEAITGAAARLSRKNIESSRFDAELLLCHVLERDRAWLLAHLHDFLEPEHANIFALRIDRRAMREPLQHILGFQEFWGLRFSVNPDVLIPRPETEFLVEAALSAIGTRSAPLIIDLCTGSGCIAISLAKELPAARLIATDRSEAALAVARRNALNHEVADRIIFLSGDLFQPLVSQDLLGKVDVIVTNPPYIREMDLDSLQPEVRDYEPRISLIAGPEGIEIASLILKQAPAYLKPGGTLLMEMGMGQENALLLMMNEAGLYGASDIIKDLAGIGRVIRTKKI
jgi:release factor glutamine methyltransferase